MTGHTILLTGFGRVVDYTCAVSTYYGCTHRVVDYTWAALTPTVLPGYDVAAVAPLLPPRTANRAALGLAALPLKHGLAYTFEVSSSE